MSTYFKLSLLSWVAKLIVAESGTCSASSPENCQAEGVSLLQHRERRTRAQHAEDDWATLEMDAQTHRIREEFRRLNRTARRLNLSKQLNKEGAFKVYSHDFEVTGFSQSEEAA